MVSQGKKYIILLFEFEFEFDLIMIHNCIVLELSSLCDALDGELRQDVQLRAS